MNALYQILAQLIGYPSVTPEDRGCQEFMIEYLSRLGFTCLRFDNKPVSNFFAYYGSEGPLLVFAGHTDVVPVGAIEKWNSPPFTLTSKENVLYGRGVADMKGSLAAMLVMADRWVNKTPSKGRLGFLITSGEEGDAFHLGTPYVMEELTKLGISIDYCVVGEPSSTQEAGDVIKIGRRGSLSAQILVHGKQGHVAYPDFAENPIHRIAPALTQLCGTQWDEGNAWFQPTSMQITHIQSGGQASNIIPGELLLHLNFRFGTAQSETSLKERTAHIFKEHQLHFDIQWRLNGEPFLTKTGLLLTASKQAIFEQTGLNPELSTSGGTSDGRFIAPYGTEVVEIGPRNASIHQVNESLSFKDLESLEKIYFAITEKLLQGSSRD